MSKHNKSKGNKHGGQRRGNLINMRTMLDGEQIVDQNYAQTLQAYRELFAKQDPAYLENIVKVTICGGLEGLLVAAMEHGTSFAGFIEILKQAVTRRNSAIQILTAERGYTHQAPADPDTLFAAAGLPVPPSPEPTPAPGDFLIVPPSAEAHTHQDTVMTFGIDPSTQYPSSIEHEPLQ
jgi:hypothetical protein